MKLERFLKFDPMRAQMKYFPLWSAALALLLQACSEPQEAPTSAINEVAVHGEGWTNPASPNFHGTALAANGYKTEDCRPCHGGQYDGGTAGVSCYKCHASYPHPPSGWVSGSSAHYVFLKDNCYDLPSCQPCHGQDFSTIKVNNSCLTCHTQQGGPAACNTCHGNKGGNAADLINAAPPLGLDNESQTTTPAVGAHQAHFAYFKSRSAGQVCQECHTVPAAFTDPQHVQDCDSRAELVFNGALGSLKTEGGNRVPQPVYDFNANTCSGTYCHGNWGLRKDQSKYGSESFYAADIMTGNTIATKWTDAAGAPCGSCHGLPPQGHVSFPITACTICHIGVVDGFGAIIDSTKHMNGQINVFSEEYPMK